MVGREVSDGRSGAAERDFEEQEGEQQGESSATLEAGEYDGGEAEGATHPHELPRPAAPPENDQHPGQRDGDPGGGDVARLPEGPPGEAEGRQPHQQRGPSPSAERGAGGGRRAESRRWSRLGAHPRLPGDIHNPTPASPTASVCTNPALVLAPGSTMITQ